MARVPVPIAGPAHKLRNPNVDCEDTINWYLESTEPGNAKAPLYLAPTPGVRPFAQIDADGGWTIFYQDGRTFAVIGTSFVEIFIGGTISIHGTVTQATSIFPASIVSNGTAGGQLLIISGLDGYVFTLATNAFTVIDNGTFPGTGFPFGQALQCEFMDGYGIVLVSRTRRFFISALEDFTSWDPLDVAERSMGSDNLTAVIRNHRELWFPGTKTGEVWYDSGDPLFPFAPVPGVFLEQGSASHQMVRLENTIAWMGLDERGTAVVYMAKGYTPSRISTHAVETDLANFGNRLDEIRMFSQQQQGHIFLWLSVPGRPWTWVFDTTVGAWHKRALWNTHTSEWELHLAAGAAWAFSQCLVIDRLSGVVYTLDMDTYHDDVVAA